MLDYERSDASSTEDTHNRLAIGVIHLNEIDFNRSYGSKYLAISFPRLDSNPALHELDDATILSELEQQGEEVMRQWTSLLGTAQPMQQHTANSNTVNNNINNSNSNNNNHSSTESGCVFALSLGFVVGHLSVTICLVSFFFLFSF